MKLRFPQYRARTWLQIAFLPSVALVIIAVGVELIRDLRELILDGFDRELESVGRVHAAFLDEAAHAWLMEEPQFVALTAGSPREDFWTVLGEGDAHALALIDHVSGNLKPERVLLDRPVVDIAFLPEVGLIGAGRDAANQLYQIDPATGVMSPWQELDAPVTALAVDHASSRIWAVGRGTVLEWSRSEPSWTEVPGDWQTLIDEMVYDPDAQILWARDKDDTSWSGFDWSSQTTVAAPAWDSWYEVPRAVAFDAEHGYVVGAAELLLGVDLANGTVLREDYATAFGKEDSDFYQRAVLPFRRTRERLGLTYLYTKTVTDQSAITYGLDGSVDDDHSPLHTRDELPLEEVTGVERMLATGDIHFTQLRRWENWGLLKSVFVPLNSLNAMVGVDVNVTVIEYRTRQSSVAVFGLVGISLMIASAWSLRISRSLRGPIERLKAGALKLAVGDAKELSVLRPQEIGRLALALNEVGESMRSLAQKSQLLLDRKFFEQSEVLICRTINSHWLAANPPTDIDASSPAPGLPLDESRFAICWWSPSTDKQPVGMMERSAWLEQFKVKLRSGARGLDGSDCFQGLAGIAVVAKSDKTVTLYRHRRFEAQVEMTRSETQQMVLRSQTGPKLAVSDYRFVEVCL